MQLPIKNWSFEPVYQRQFAYSNNDIIIYVIALSVIHTSTSLLTDSLNQ